MMEHVQLPFVNGKGIISSLPFPLLLTNDGKGIDNYLLDYLKACGWDMGVGS